MTAAGAALCAALVATIASARESEGKAELVKPYCAPFSTFLGQLGVSSSIVFANLGAAYGTAKAGVGISTMGVMRPDMVMKSLIPVVMAGVLGIYGLITSVIINGNISDKGD